MVLNNYNEKATKLLDGLETMAGLQQGPNTTNAKNILTTIDKINYSKKYLNIFPQRLKLKNV